MTSQALETYQAWLREKLVDEETKQELISIENQMDEIEDRFYKELTFGTGGLRGVIGAGTNRMNVYTIGRATQGLAQYVLKQPKENKSVVIAYDSRNQSPEFALESALVFAGNGITAYVFESLRPTPELSFAVRALKASAGIVITASHNPPEYNGYKAYDVDGGQLVPHEALQVTNEIKTVEAFSQVQRLDQKEAESKRLLQWIGEEMDGKYVQAVTAISRNAEVIQHMKDSFHIVYTPLHGAGNQIVRRTLQQVGFTQVHIVPEQEHPDAQFSTVKSPNPEEKEAFSLAIPLAEEVQADIIIGTDPDCDRMGAVVKNDQGEYITLTGNQSGALMLHYLLESMKERNELPQDGVVIKTIVTSEMGAVIAQHYNMQVMNTLTGFKYIGEKMTQFEQSNQHTFVFGYEESYGYLAGNYCRDKDAVVASMLICEAAAYYKAQGKSLYDVLQELYRTYGYFIEDLESRTLKGKDGVEKIQAIMNDWRQQIPAEVNGISIVKVEDYSEGIYDLPKENVLKFQLEDESWFCLRPSGTEPKIKVYFAMKGTSSQDAAHKLEQLKESVMHRVDQI